MSNLHDRLQRLRSTSTTPSTEKKIMDISLPSNSRVVETDEGSFVMRECRYSLDHQHGHYSLGQLVEGYELLSRISKRFQSMKNVQSYRDLLFFDTETTGLGVGAGNVPFMIGYGYYTHTEFVSVQLFIRHPGEERAMLLYFNEFIQRFTHLVTYNGRTFDWPIVKNRYVMNRIPFTDGDLEQLDLLYISRNLWKNSIISCRLSNVEEQRLGIRRHNDVSGAYAPMIYFQYLADGDVGPLEGVFLHNELDVLTLATLAVHLGTILAGQLDLSKVHTDDVFRIGVWLDQVELLEQAEIAFAELLKRPAETRRRYLLAIATLYKKKKWFEQAVQLWEEAAGIGRVGQVTHPIHMLQPLIELAMYYEHQCKRYDQALDLVEEVLNRAEKRQAIRRLSDKDRQLIEQLHKRRARLMTKVYRGVSGEVDLLMF
ncbi:MAG: ribonuclease H-like domain-containing protein [Paenibacillaceae bacterium]